MDQFKQKKHHSRTVMYPDDNKHDRDQDKLAATGPPILFLSLLSAKKFIISYL